MVYLKCVSCVYCVLQHTSYQITCCRHVQSYLTEFQKSQNCFLGIPDDRRQMISFLSQTNSIRTCLYHCQRIHSGKLRVQFKIWNNFHFYILGYILSTQLSQIVRYIWLPAAIMSMRREAAKLGTMVGQTLFEGG